MPLNDADAADLPVKVKTDDASGGIDLDRARYELELRKFEADAETRRLNALKLHEELNELRKPWFTRASAAPAYVTILVALVGGFLAFGTNLLKSNISELKRSNEAQKREQKRLQ